MFNNKIVIKHLKEQLKKFIETYGMRSESDKTIWLRRMEIERRLQTAEDIDYLNDLKRELETGLKKKELTCTYVPPLFDGPLQIYGYLNCYHDGKNYHVSLDEKQLNKFQD